METLYSLDCPIWNCGEPNSSSSSSMDDESYNSTTNMAAFVKNSLELESSPGLFASSQCHNFREGNELTGVNLSLKSVPQICPMSPMPYHSPYSQSQQLLSPNGCPSNYAFDENFIPPTVPSTGPGFGTHFPSMSVNVSMNMTMGYLPADPNLQHQMSWPGTMPPPPNSHGHASSSSYGSSYSASPTPQNFCPQPYSATYSFAADIRPEGTMESLRSQWIPNAPSSLITSALSSCSSALGPSSPSKRHRPTRSGDNVSPTFTNCGSRSNLCRICGKSYARPSTLKTHLRTHSGEKPYRCIECQKSFSQAANLTAHVRTHSGEKPFRCPICDRRFSQSSSVTTHMRTHSGERPYRCRLCKKAFSDSSTLTKHLRIHSGEKPYQCKLCLLRFSQSGNLNRHMRVHSSSH